MRCMDVRSRARKRELISTLLVNANVRYQVPRKCCTSREALDTTKQTQTKCQGHVARQLLTYRIDKIYLKAVGPSCMAQLLPYIRQAAQMTSTLVLGGMWGQKA